MVRRNVNSNSKTMWFCSRLWDLAWYQILVSTGGEQSAAGGGIQVMAFCSLGNV